jgi:hypothetical protein
MIASWAGMNRISNELGRTQNEFSLPLATNPTNSNELTSPEFVSFRTSSLLFIADFAVHDLFHRKERKDDLIGLYAINHRERREHREKLQSISIPVMAYETAAASRFRTRMPRIARIFADIVDRYESLFHSPIHKPQRSQRTQSRMEKLLPLRVFCDRLTLSTSRLTRIYTYPRVSASSAQSAFYRCLSALVRVHPRPKFVSLSDRTAKIRGDI